MGEGFCDVGCDCLSCVNESLRSRVRELEVENIAMANAIGNLRALLPDYDDNGVIKKISELERLRDGDVLFWANERIRVLEGAVEWALQDMADDERFCRELRRRAMMEEKLWPSA